MVNIKINEELVKVSDQIFLRLILCLMANFSQCLNYMCEFGGLFFGHGRPITMSACLPLEQHKTDCENLSRATLSKRMGQKICHH